MVLVQGCGDGFKLKINQKNGTKSQNLIFGRKVRTFEYK